jgi:inner membrane protein
MATLYTHAAVGLGLGKLLTDRPLPWSFWVLTAALPVMSDLDVFSNCSYGSMCGHRGFTHSLVFAAVLAGVTALRRFDFSA